MIRYKVEILLNEDEDMKEKYGTPYFWCILEWTGSIWVNSGRHCWTHSVNKAFEEAYKAYEELKRG